LVEEQDRKSGMFKKKGGRKKPKPRTQMDGQWCNQGEKDKKRRMMMMMMMMTNRLRETTIHLHHLLHPLDKIHLLRLHPPRAAKGHAHQPKKFEPDIQPWNPNPDADDGSGREPGAAGGRPNREPQDAGEESEEEEEEEEESDDDLNDIQRWLNRPYTQKRERWRKNCPLHNQQLKYFKHRYTLQKDDQKAKEMFNSLQGKRCVNFLQHSARSKPEKLDKRPFYITTVKHSLSVDSLDDDVKMYLRDSTYYDLQFSDIDAKRMQMIHCRQKDIHKNFEDFFEYYGNFLKKYSQKLHRIF